MSGSRRRTTSDHAAPRSGLTTAGTPLDAEQIATWLREARQRNVYLIEGRVAMYLVSDRDQTVSIDALGLVVRFAAGEAIHTEDSYKYSDAEIGALAVDSGFAIERQWHDAQWRFSDVLLKAHIDSGTDG